MHIGIISLDPDHVPAGLPLSISGKCITIYSSIQNALSAGELRLRSSNPDDPPVMEFRYMTDLWDLQRAREGVRLSVRLGDHPAFRDLFTRRVSPADADLARRGAGCVAAGECGHPVPHVGHLQDGACR